MDGQRPTWAGIWYNVYVRHMTLTLITVTREHLPEIAVNSARAQIHQPAQFDNLCTMASEGPDLHQVHTGWIPDGWMVETTAGIPFILENYYE